MGTDNVSSVAIVKVLGLETEFGIVIRGAAEPNPITASSALINAYVAELSRKVNWDFEDETPGRDARGFAREGAAPPEVETHLVNAVLTNGARYYVDHAHPEYSTPECSNVREAVLYDKAGELILARSIVAAARLLPPGQSLMVLKNNSDGKGNSYGSHENYLMDRSVPFGRIVASVIPHFVSRQVFTGAGKVGTEATTTGGVEVGFQLTQRADFFEEEVGLETTLKRPIVNTRDEPHCDAQKYRRLHVILGDANLSEVATLLKVGTTALVLAMIEDDWFARAGDHDFTLAAPVSAMRQVSYDLGLRRPLERADGSTMTALEMQWEHLDLARKYGEDCGFDAVGGRGDRPPDRSPVGAGAGRPGGGPHVARRAAGLGGQVPGRQRLPRAPRAELGGPEAGGDGLAVPRRQPAAIALRPAGHGAPGRSGGGQGGHHRAADDHPGVLPGQVPAAVVGPGGCGQLGLPGVRPRRRPAAPGADDGTPAGNTSTRRRVARQLLQPGRAAGAVGIVGRRQDRNMAEREQIKKQTPPRTEEEVEEVPAGSKRGEELKAELDDLLDEIDEVLEDNAEEFVRSYVQKGGQ